jgi:hypothetical protein
MSLSRYDPAALLARARLWHAEAADATSPAMRVFCLKEAVLCERMVQRSMAVPVLREEDHAPRKSVATATPVRVPSAVE